MPIRPKATWRRSWATPSSSWPGSRNNGFGPGAAPEALATAAVLATADRGIPRGAHVGRRRPDRPASPGGARRRRMHAGRRRRRAAPGHAAAAVVTCREEVHRVRTDGGWHPLQLGGPHRNEHVTFAQLWIWCTKRINPIWDVSKRDHAHASARNQGRSKLHICACPLKVIHERLLDAHALLPRRRLGCHFGH